MIVRFLGERGRMRPRRQLEREIICARLDRRNCFGDAWRGWLCLITEEWLGFYCEYATKFIDEGLEVYDEGECAYLFRSF